MKKNLFKGAAAASALLATMFFAACSDTPEADDGRNSYIDTYQLDAVDITVKAYPGFNYVSWGASTTGATIKVLRDDGKEIAANSGFSGVTTPATDSTTGIASNFAAIDTDVKDGVNYTYTAYVLTSGNNSEVSAATANNDYKTYYTVKGNKKSASATAIHPDVYKNDNSLTTALDLTSASNAGSSNYVISEKNLSLKQDADGELYVTFPTKAYLKYSVYIVTGNAIDIFDGESAGSTVVNVNPNFYKMDSTYSYKLPAVTAGTYQTVVKVEAWANEYAPSYVKSEPYTVDALNIDSATSGVKAGYIDAGKTIRIIWTPATKKVNGSALAYDHSNALWPAANYKVYSKDKNNVYTELALTVKDDNTQAAEKVYYADYTVTDNTVEYDFFVVLSDAGKVENNAVEKTANVKAYGLAEKVAAQNATASFVERDYDDAYNDALLTVNVNQVTDEPRIMVKSAKYKVVDKNAVSYDSTNSTEWVVQSLLLDTEFTSVAVVPSADYTKYDVLVKGVELGSKVIFLYTLSQEGKEDRVAVITTSSAAALADVSMDVSLALDPTEVKKADGTFDYYDYYNAKVIYYGYGNSSKYDYALYYATVDSNDASYETVTKWTAMPVSRESTNSSYKTAKGIFGSSTVFKLVKTNKAFPKAEGAVGVTYVTWSDIRY